MSREIKFRAWDQRNRMFWHFELVHGELGYPQFALGDKESGGLKGLAPWQQYTGLKDKSGRDVFEGDILTDYDPHGQLFTDDIHKDRKWLVEFGAAYCPIPFSIPSGWTSSKRAINETLQKQYAACYLLCSVHRPKVAYPITDVWLQELQIIGNIYENPDLLETRL